MQEPPDAHRENSDPDALVQRVSCRRVELSDERHAWPHGASTVSDWVPSEEPLEIHIQGHPWVVLMRSPGHDVQLATGFVVSERIARPEQIEAVRQSSIGMDADHTVLVTLREGTSIERRVHTRRGFASSSCGSCGKTRRAAGLDLAAALPHERRNRESARRAFRTAAWLCPLWRAARRGTSQHRRAPLGSRRRHRSTQRARQSRGLGRQRRRFSS